MSIRGTKYNEKLTEEEKDHIYDYMSNENTRKYNFLKASEELQELSLILTQTYTKPGKITLDKVIEEIGDVIVRLEVLSRMFPKEAVDERINNKLNQFKRFIETGKHKNI